MSFGRCIPRVEKLDRRCADTRNIGPLSSIRCIYHLRQIRAFRKSLTTESVKTLVHALIASRLDYCNSVFYQLSAANLQALQSVLNAGAHLIMRKRKYDHITSTLREDLYIYTGCLFVSEYCTSWAPLFTSVFVGQLHLIWRIYVFQSLPILVVVIFAQHHNTCKCLGRERWPMDHEVLLFLVLLSGILCHRPYTCIDHYIRTVSEWTKDNAVSFGLWDMTPRRFRDCLGR